MKPSAGAIALIPNFEIIDKPTPTQSRRGTGLEAQPELDSGLELGNQRIKLEGSRVPSRFFAVPHTAWCGIEY